VARSQEQLPETRNRLIDAAIAQLSKGGEVSLRVTAVAEAAGVTEPAVHYFFGNREGLLVAALAEQFKRLLSQMYIPFREAALGCTKKVEFREVCIAAFEAAFDPRRAVVRTERVAILGSAVNRPDLGREISAAHNESLIPLLYGLSFAQAKGWIPASLDLLAFSYWNTGQVTGRMLAELEASEVDLEQWSALSISAALHLLGLD
jgi:AcrR family transcriptional regulator